MLAIIPKSKYWFAISGTLMTLSVIALATFGLRQGIDFTGGSLLEIQFSQEVSSSQVEEALKSLNTGNEQSLSEEDAGEASVSGAPRRASLEIVDLGKPLVQSLGNGAMLIRLKYINNYTHNQIMSKLAELNAGEAVVELRYESVGPTIGATLRTNAYKALVIAIIFIVLYIAFAFRKVPKSVSAWKFGLVTIAALIHDVLIICGVFAVLGLLLNVEVDSLFITALLTILGYSVNDTIVVLDRIRENMILSGRAADFPEIVNASINQTMARSINTSLTTLLILIALFFLASESIRYFVLALIIGIISGTYSSIFVASPLLVLWRKK
ncbi:MAG: protein translocase subunit SecF [Candidatus Gracilibacteria bacterium]|nr:protein translocase subunit SecF [Candidatus Gracilibacteria bacterium]